MCCDTLNATQGPDDLTTREPDVVTVDITDIIYCIIATIGISGNGLVLFVFFKVPQLRVNSSILIRNQALIDLTSSVLLVLVFLFPEASLAELLDRSEFTANVICKIWYSQYLFWACIKTSTINLVFLTLERYFAVVHPFQHRRHVTKRNISIFALLAWIVGGAIEIHAPAIHEVYEDGDCSSRGVSLFIRHIVAYISLVTTLVIPVTLMTFVYTSIIIVLRPKNNLHSDRPSKTITFASKSTTTDSTKAVVLTSLESVRNRSTSMTLRDKPPSTLGIDNLGMNGDIPSSYPTRLRGGGAHAKDTSLARTRWRLGYRRARLSRKEKARRNTLLTMFLVCTTYVICWAPDIVLYFHHNVVQKHSWSDPFHRFVILLAFSNVCTNPIIYTIKYKRFQKGLRAIFRKKLDWASETT